MCCSQGCRLAILKLLYIFTRVEKITMLYIRASFLFVKKPVTKRGKAKMTTVVPDCSQNYQCRLMVCFINMCR